MLLRVVLDLWVNLYYIVFRLSLEEGISPDDLSTAKVTSIFKAGDENNFGNYRPICFILFQNTWENHV